jgi:hypothetical protein
MPLDTSQGLVAQRLTFVLGQTSPSEVVAFALPLLFDEEQSLFALPQSTDLAYKKVELKKQLSFEQM